jgi:integrase
MTGTILKNWLKAAGTTKKISFHSSRHTFGSLQVDAGTSVYTVQHMLGHISVPLKLDLMNSIRFRSYKSPKIYAFYLQIADFQHRW